MEKVKLNFKFADANGDGQLSRQEFMTLRNVVGSHYIDGFMMFDANSDRALDLGEFSIAYETIQPGVKDGLIYTAYLIGDTNKDRVLDFEEFHLLAQLREENYFALDGKNAFSHIEYKGFTREDGYCHKPNDKDPEIEDWIATGMVDIGGCALACRRNSECNAWTFYHEEGQCYFFKPKQISTSNEWFASSMGNCLIKN